MKVYDRHMNPEGGRRRQIHIHKSGKDYNRKESKQIDDVTSDEMCQGEWGNNAQDLIDGNPSLKIERHL